MSKIICDICGTTYPDTADQCPICGCSRDAAADLLGDDVLMEEIVEEPKGKGGRFSSKKKKEIFDFDEVNGELEEEPVEEEPNPYEEEEEQEYDETPRHNTFAVILLTILIVVLLLSAGYLFVRFFLPNMDSDETTPVTTVAVETQEETTEVTVPCLSLVITSEKTAVLNSEGYQFLLHVIAMPEDTTDRIIYTSGDESVATVTEDGKIVAVGEGETKIYITCGNVQMDCDVICDFTPETVPPTTEAEVVETTAETTVETTAEEVPETTAAAVANPDVVLKLKKTDISLAVHYEFQLVLDCELNPEDVEWSSEHSYIASVSETGVVKALKYGTTSITAKYGDQEVQCIVRCG